MGSAFVKAFIEHKVIHAEDITVSDPLDKKLVELGGLGVATSESNAELTDESDVLFLCVKPQVIDDVLIDLKGLCNGKLVVSIVAGVTSSYMEEKLSSARVIRVMPNTPALVGDLAAGYCRGKTATEDDSRLIGGILKKIGVAVEVEETLMDAVTGLSGSGPAYIYFIIDALAKAGVKQGLNEADSLRLSAKTAKGAAEMILSTGNTPQDLIDMVCSPGGTTIEGMRVLEESDLETVLEKTVKAATEKSKKLAK